MSQTDSDAIMAAASEVIARLRAHVRARMFGVDSAIDQLLIALMARGHILLEDVPGVGKTAMAKAFAAALGLEFHRIQCTPDMLPADVTGGLVFHPGEADFQLRKGPIFTNLLLVDEINRALPRTQSALLEAMAEGQVTIDGVGHALPEPFMVIATQNPIESQGVFPLPEAQLDRFLLKTRLGYPSADDDLAILDWHLQAFRTGSNAISAVPDVVDDAPAAWGILEAAMAAVHVSRPVQEYIAAVTRVTREQADVAVGASPRAMIMLAQAARAAAVLEQRLFVIPDDVQRVAEAVLFHRVVRLGAGDESDQNPGAWIREVLAHVTVPIESAGA